MNAAIMIDQREPESIRAQFPEAAVTLLDAGDAWIACDDGNILLIERKTSDDFLNSLRDGRLFDQIARLVDHRIVQQLNGKRQTYWPYLVITGPLMPGKNGMVYTDRETGWGWTAVQGALLTVQEMGCYIVQCPSDADYHKTVMALVNRDRKSEIDVMPQRQPIPVDAKSVFLMGLPGIGIERAKSILEWSGGVLAHALIGLTDLSIKTPVGDGGKRNIRGFLGLKDRQELILEIDQNGEKINISEVENV